MPTKEEVRALVSAMSMEAFASIIDHTLLNPVATIADIRSFVIDAIDLGVNICVNESRIDDVLKILKEQNADIRIASVIGFPLGATATDIKVHSAKWALESGADEVDMVINIGYLKDRDPRFWEDIAAVAYMVHDMGCRMPITQPVLKVIIETCYLTKEDIEYATDTIAAIADEYRVNMMVKTSTGFGNPPEGRAKGATPEDVRTIRDTLGDRFANGVGIKASGGIRTLNDVVDMMLAAGIIEGDTITVKPHGLRLAFRIGTSSGSKIMREFIEMKNSI